MIRTLPFASVLALAASMSAQGLLQAGYRDVAFPNTTGQGTPYLFSRVVYPSETGGHFAPVAPNTNGWPVIVMLHGFSMWGQHYTLLGETWAKAGFLVLQLDTGIFDYLVLAADAQAAIGALAVANAEQGGFFEGAIDVHRVGLAGHSMGGGVLGMVLATNPDYRCGLALAPVFPGAATAAQVHVPVGIVVGQGDTVTPWQTLSLPYYQALAPQSGLKFCYVMNGSCDHMNVAGLSGANHPVSLRVADLTTGFFRHFLGVDHTGLDRCLGPAALQAPQFASLLKEVVEPQIWAAAEPEIGHSVRVSVVAEEGPSATLAAVSMGSGVQTTYGTLLLDPTTLYTWNLAYVQRDGRIDALLNTPNDRNLIGFTVALQILGAGVVAPLRFGSAAEFVIGG